MHSVCGRSARKAHTPNRNGSPINVRPNDREDLIPVMIRLEVLVLSPFSGEAGVVNHEHH